MKEEIDIDSIIEYHENKIKEHQKKLKYFLEKKKEFKK